MSKSLHWKHVPKEPEDNYLSDALKAKLAQRYWQYGGPLGGDPVEVNIRNIPYLQGLADCGIEDADTLIGLIREHGAVLLYME